MKGGIHARKTEDGAVNGLWGHTDTILLWLYLL
jgi:hypothetical protein